VELELEPPQPEPVVAAVDELLRDERTVDPWWQAGVDDALESATGQGEATARPRRTLGADRA
jgi:hypothetical protein